MKVSWKTDAWPIRVRTVSITEQHRRQGDAWLWAAALFLVTALVLALR